MSIDCESVASEELRSLRDIQRLLETLVYLMSENTAICNLEVYLAYPPSGI